MEITHLRVKKVDKNEYRARAEEIRRLIAEKQYREAVEIADTIDWRNVPSGMMLCTISDLYKVCRRYEDSRDVLLLAYQRNPKGRLILYSLCELSIKLDDVVNAVEYYKEYLQVAPRDTGKFILQYKLYEAQEASLEERIAILEELQKRECKEKWMYELAYLYHRVGLGTSCVEECNQIVIFFGEGKYVLKALELKSLHEPLSAEQDELYKRLTGQAEEDITVQAMNVGQYNTIDLQKELADNLKEVLFDDSKTTDINSSPTTVIGRPAEPEAVVEAENEPAPEALSESEDEKTIAIDIVESSNQAPELVTREENSNPGGDFVEIRDENSDGQLSFIKTEDNVEIGDTLVYSREEIETALGGSKVMDRVEDSAASVNFADMLSLEGDGQISLIVPEQAMVEKQITGQLSIDEVLAEYERIRLENERKWSEGVRHRIKQSTSSLLKNFDETSQNGLLEELEESVQNDPDSVAYGPNLTEEEVIYLEEELAAQEESLANSDEAVEDSIPEETEEEIIVVDEPVKETTGEMTEITFVEEESAEEEITEESDIEDEEPSPEELIFDRTPYISEESVEEEPIAEESAKEESVEELDEEPQSNSELESDDITQVLSDEDSDYLMKVAAAAEQRELEEQRAIEAFEKSMQQMMEEENAKKLADEEVSEDAPEEVADETSEDNIEFEEETAEEEYEKTSEEDSEEDIAQESIEKENTEVSEAEASQQETETTRVKDPYFSEEQWTRFESFLQTELGREQIKDALNNISDSADTGNIIIGSVDTDSPVELGRALIIEQSKKGVISGKAAKIKASSLNAKDAEATLSKIYDGAIIIQDAEELRRETLDGIRRAMSVPDKKMLVILAASHRHKHKFIMENSDMLEAFTISIDIEELDNQELVRLANEYAHEKEYSIDEMGTLALYRRIDEKRTNSHSVLFTEVKEMVDEAIAHSSKKNMKHFFDVLLGKRYDGNDMIILGEKDFTE